MLKSLYMCDKTYRTGVSNTQNTLPAVVNRVWRRRIGYLDRLGHEAVDGVDHEDNDVGCLRPAQPHRTERLVRERVRVRARVRVRVGVRVGVGSGSGSASGSDRIALKAW